MKELLLILIIITTMFNVYSQDISTTEDVKKMTVHDIQRNSVYVEYNIITLSAIYERTVPIGNKVGILFGGGISQGVDFTTETNLLGKFAFMFGGYKHFFEGGIQVAPFGDDINILVPIVGYRYQSKGGFLLRVDVSLFRDSGTAKDGSGDEWVEAYPFPGIALGYSF